MIREKAILLILMASCACAGEAGQEGRSADGSSTGPEQVSEAQELGAEWERSQREAGKQLKLDRFRQMLQVATSERAQVYSDYEEMIQDIKDAFDHVETQMIASVAPRKEESVKAKAFMQKLLATAKKAAADGFLEPLTSRLETTIQRIESDDDWNWEWE